MLILILNEVQYLHKAVFTFQIVKITPPQVPVT